MISLNSKSHLMKTHFSDSLVKYSSARNIPQQSTTLPYTSDIENNPQSPKKRIPSNSKTINCALCLQDIDTDKFEIHYELELSSMESKPFSIYDDELKKSNPTSVKIKINPPKIKVKKHKRIVDNSDLESSPSNSTSPIKSISIKTRSSKSHSDSDSELDKPLAKIIKTRKQYTKKQPVPKNNAPKNSLKNKPLKNQPSSSSKQVRKSTRPKKPLLNTLRDESDIDETAENHIEKNICFICNKVLNTNNLIEINSHIDSCLNSQTNDQQFPDSQHHSNAPSTRHDSPEPAEFFEYEWAGQTRVRATALLDGPISSVFNSYSNSPLESNANSHPTSASNQNAPLLSNDPEVDIEIDLNENNDIIYGQPQYTQKDLDKALKKINSDSKKTPPSKKITASSSNNKTKPNDNNQFLSSLSTSQLLLIIDSLKSQLNDQSDLIQSSPKCLVCLSNFSVPLTSVLCWHVHCESCWLKTLSVKKLCPQCKLITQPSDLRRIYI
ncbi:E3 ubiquitin-protein ligase [Smittium culicis]|uniref:E3 ubiquitin-protein ligase n=1 Tax=Smittium culicis TaxID=133412 RepID=A0A1R1XZP9_9FUNG|nr:E3 ubiquitin-protein ligase [Smittium culicis]